MSKKSKRTTDWPKRTKPKYEHVDLNNSSTELSNGQVFKLETHCHKTSNVTAFFRPIKPHLLECIQNADKIYGCIAWLTDSDILDALSKKQCAFVVNKEEFIYPKNCWDTLKRKLKVLKKFDVPLSYSEWIEDGYTTVEANQPLTSTDETKYNHMFDTFFSGKYLSTYQKMIKTIKCSDSNLTISENGTPEFHLLCKSKLAGKRIDPVRCLGILKSDSDMLNVPRMHDKFMVFIKNQEWSVWTGSFNCSFNSNNSIENAVLIQDNTIARAYLEEWQQIFVVSESRFDDDALPFTKFNIPETAIGKQWSKLFDALEWMWMYENGSFTVKFGQDSITFEIDPELKPGETKDQNNSPKPLENKFILGNKPFYATLLNSKHRVTSIGVIEDRVQHLIHLGFCSYCECNTFTCKPTKRNCFFCKKSPLVSPTIDIMQKWEELDSN
jgi:hypothetical protein